MITDLKQTDSSSTWRLMIRCLNIVKYVDEYAFQFWTNPLHPCLFLFWICVLHLLKWLFFSVWEADFKITYICIYRKYFIILYTWIFMPEMYCVLIQYTEEYFSGVLRCICSVLPFKRNIALWRKFIFEVLN